MSTVDLHTLTGAYALHALSEDERGAFERHAADCEACTEEVRELTETAARLALAVSAVPREVSWAPTEDPADVPITTSASLRSTPASPSPYRIPASQPIPAWPPPPSTSALPATVFRPPALSSASSPARASRSPR
ncbi:zf-HC2 domain-containing protein, partial [Streptomyces sp. NPDC005568]|uniref:zf-HC2 domain-containing protein n=1 Tax=Streptomyces sp. NPDC005568 TaxID=3156887 RepID=UPI0033A76452